MRNVAWPSKRVFLILLGMIVLAGLWLRIRDLGRSSFWLDEVLSARITTQPLAEIGDLLPANKPPLDYYLQHFFICIKESEFMARLPACLAGTLAIAAMAWLALGLWGGEPTPRASEMSPSDTADLPDPDASSLSRARCCALCAAGLLAASAYHLRYSQEARPYELMFFLLVLGQGFFVRILAERGRPRPANWVGFFVCSLLAVWTMYFSAIFLALNVVFLLLRAKARFLSFIWSKEIDWGPVKGDLARLGGLLVCVAVIALTLTPRFQRIKDGAGEKPMFPFGEPSVRGALAQSNILGVAYHEDQGLKFADTIPSSAVFVPFALLGLGWAARRRPGAAAYLALQLFGTLAIVVFFYWKTDHWMRARYLMMITIPYYVFLGSGAALLGCWLGRLSRGLLAAVPVLALCLFSLVWILNVPSHRRDWRALAEFARDHGTEQTALVALHSLGETIAMDYYIKLCGTELPLFGVNEQLDKIAEIHRQYPKSFYFTSPLFGEAINDGFGGAAQLGWRTCELDVWHMMSPEELFAHEDVRRRALEAFEQDGLLDFGNEHFDFLGPGWEPHEAFAGGRFRWANRTESIVFLYLDQPRDYRVAFRADPLLRGTAPRQVVQFVLNDQLVARVPLRAGLNEYEFAAPREAFRQGLNRLALRFARADRVRDIAPGAQDSRRLAVRFDFIRFTPAEVSTPDDAAAWFRLLAVHNKQFDGRLDFGEGATPFLGQGWEPVELEAGEPFRWANEYEAELFVPLERAADQRLVFRAAPLVYQDWPGQGLELLVNGQSVGRVELDALANDYSFEIDADHWRAGENLLVFRFDRLTKVSEAIPETNDSRQLAVRFTSLRLEERP
ncbi:hypothetical protein ACFL34_03050 [Candidatus Sumerlaeota bacterium]